MIPQRTKILITDDHALFREGLAILISRWDDFEVIGEAENGRQALELCQKLTPDIVLMDVNMPVMGGVDATRRILEEFPSIAVVMLSMSVDEQNLFEAIKAGARGYVLKDIHARQLHNLLRGVLIGEWAISGLVAAKVLTEFKQLQQPSNNARSEIEKDPYKTLTDRETQILQFVADGLSNSEIGEKLFLSDQTIKKHLSDIMQKLHVNNRVQAAAYALRKGLAK